MMRFFALSLLILFVIPAGAYAEEMRADYAGIARALQKAPAVTLTPAANNTARPAAVRQDAPARRDSVWNGALIGAGIGAGSGYLWAYTQCGTNDSECFMIAGTVGIIGGAAIGAVVGAVADALHK